MIILSEYNGKHGSERPSCMGSHLGNIYTPIQSGRHARDHIVCDIDNGALFLPNEHGEVTGTEALQKIRTLKENKRVRHEERTNSLLKAEAQRKTLPCQ